VPPPSAVTRAASGRAPRASVPRGFIYHMGTAVLLGVALFTEEAKPSRGNVDDQACLQRLRGCDATIAVLWLPRQSPATASRAWRSLPGVREDSWQTTQLYARGHTGAAVPRDPTCTKRPAGGLLEHPPLPQGPARWAGDAYVPRLITSPSSWITP
jgi:hypothetical protein